MAGVTNVLCNRQPYVFQIALVCCYSSVALGYKVQCPCTAAVGLAQPPTETLICRGFIMLYIKLHRAKTGNFDSIPDDSFELWVLPAADPYACVAASQ